MKNFIEELEKTLMFSLFLFASSIIVAIIICIVFFVFYFLISYFISTDYPIRL